MFVGVYVHTYIHTYIHLYIYTFCGQLCSYAPSITKKKKQKTQNALTSGRLCVFRVNREALRTSHECLVPANLNGVLHALKKKLDSTMFWFLFYC